MDATPAQMEQTMVQLNKNFQTNNEYLHKMLQKMDAANAQMEQMMVQLNKNFQTNNEYLKRSRMTRRSGTRNPGSSRGQSRRRSGASRTRSP